MAIINMRGRLVVESAWPNWHLVGTVKRDKTRRNTLTLTRQVDALSKIIRAASGASLPTVQCTPLNEPGLLSVKSFTVWKPTAPEGFTSNAEGVLRHPPRQPSRSAHADENFCALVRAGCESFLGRSDFRH